MARTRAGEIGARELWLQCVECRLMFRVDLANRDHAASQAALCRCAMHESLEYLGRIAEMTMRDGEGKAAPECERKARWV